jgi:hypothetical protein
MDPKLDMNKFYGNDLEAWVSQMEQFFILKNIQDGLEQLHIGILYLYLERWRWWEWHKQCVGGRLDWSIFYKDLCACFDRESHCLGWLTKIRQTGTVKEFITTFEQLAIHTKGLVDPFYTECFISGIKKDIQKHV